MDSGPVQIRSSRMFSRYVCLLLHDTYAVLEYQHTTISIRFEYFVAVESGRVNLFASWYWNGFHYESEIDFDNWISLLVMVNRKKNLMAPQRLF